MNINEILQRVSQIIKDDSNKSIAKALKVAPTTASTWKDRHTIPWQNLFNFAAEHNITLDWLLNGDSRGHAPPVEPQALDVTGLISIIQEQNKRIEEQGRRIDEQANLLLSQKDLISAQGDRITEQGKRIDMIADMAKTSQSANVVIATAVESMQHVLNKQHGEKIMAAETGDLKALGD